MARLTPFLVASALTSVAHGHGVILGAQGLDGSPQSVGFLVDPAIARNCTTINPCQQDATIIRDAEIAANVVNECGRTSLAGNIDIGEVTENALVANAVTQVQRGSEIAVTIHQVNADGAGPYSCDLDVTSNGLSVSGQIPLEVRDNVPGQNGFSQAQSEQFQITVQMPDDFDCTGASTGDVCTVRCRNNAVAGPFGGCFAVQQVDVEPKQNTPQNIETAADIDEILSQVQFNQADLPAAVEANANAGADSALQNLAAVEAILQETVVTRPAPVQTPELPPAPEVNAPTSSPVDDNEAVPDANVPTSSAIDAPENIIETPTSSVIDAPEPIIETPASSAIDAPEPIIETPASSAVNTSTPIVEVPTSSADVPSPSDDAPAPIFSSVNPGNDADEANDGTGAGQDGGVGDGIGNGAGNGNEVGNNDEEGEDEEDGDEEADNQGGGLLPGLGGLFGAGQRRSKLRWAKRS